MDESAGISSADPYARERSGRLASRAGVFMAVYLVLSSLAIGGSSFFVYQEALRAEIGRWLPEILVQSRARLEDLDDRLRRETEGLALDPAVRSWVDGGAPGIHAPDVDLVRGGDGLFDGLILERVGHPGAPTPWPDVDVMHPDRGSSIGVIGPGRARVASVALRSTEGGLAGWLHARVAPEALALALQRIPVAPHTEIRVLDGADRLVASTRESMDGLVPAAEAPPAAPDMALTDFTDRDGTQWIGAALPYPGLGGRIVAASPRAVVLAGVGPAVRRVLVAHLLLALAGWAVGIGIVRSLASPLMALSHAAHRIAAGERDVALPERKRRDEIGVLTAAFRAMTHRFAANARELELSRSRVEQTNDQLREQNQELSRANEILEQLSITDGLTRLHNHRFFQDYLSKEIKRASRNERPLCLILIDLDHFKRWNDEVGHAGGDEILRHAAEIMNGLIRETDLIARYGGDEFALLAANTELDGAIALAEKIRAAISETRFMVERQDGMAASLHVTVSVGVSAYHGDRRAFFNDADQALYAAKAGGRDCVIGAGDSSG